MLRDHAWRLKYTAEDGDLVRLFYVPLLENAARYDRLTGYFNAGALSLAARGIEGLVRNDGRMRLVIGCTLEPPEIESIQRGEALRTRVEQRLAGMPLAAPDPPTSDALQLLAWMVEHGFLDVKVAVPCNPDGEPVPDSGIFHEKTGIVEDQAGDRLAWTGSLNETSAGWQRNWESISVYTSWGPEPGRVNAEEKSFARIWAGRSTRVIVLDVPEAVRRDLMRFLPGTDQPRRLGQTPGNRPSEPSADVGGSLPVPAPDPTVPQASLRSQVWAFIRDAPSRPGGGQRIGEATAAVDPWPHQVRAFERLYRHWPPRLLIADEVGLGKTIQAGLLLRQTWLAGRAKRILILAPKAVLGQWQIELREKFNLNWPIYDGGKLARYPSPALNGRHMRAVGRDAWHREPAVIVSSHLMRRRDRTAELLETAEPWDLVVLDEAHHARRRAPGSPQEGGPNSLLRLMQNLKERTQGLILLTATPMQVHPVEVWDLLNLLGLPPEWSERAFLDFFEEIEHPNPSGDTMERMAALFRSAERTYGETTAVDAQHLTRLSRLKVRKVLSALREKANIPRRRLETEERSAAVAVMRAGTPIRRLISRNTRELLRRYFQHGMMTMPIAEREVDDRFLELSDAERGIYDAVEDYIADVYGRAGQQERAAVGFVMTIYRRRLASSFAALRATLRKRRDATGTGKRPNLFGIDEDLPDDDAADEADEAADTDTAGRLEREALALEQQAEIDGLLDMIDRLPPDSKLGSLREVLRALRRAGHTQMMVFTQYTDTMDFLREALAADGEEKLLCFSGRGGEVPGANGTWHPIRRDEAKRRFRDGQANILLCTDAAAEGLNFQFCGALINYDMPWNPMRVEQRIGRIDRLGQQHPTIRIINLNYEGTVETDIHRVLRDRIGLFQSVVGPLQPILARLPGRISQSVLSGEARGAHERANLIESIEHEANKFQSAGFNIDTVTENDFTMPERPPSTVTMEDLDRVIGSRGLMAPGVDIRPMGHREYGLQAPGMSESLRVTTDPAYFEEHAESTELWSPGNPVFIAPEFTDTVTADSPHGTLKDILDGV